MAECKFTAIWSRKADDVVIVSLKLKCNSHLGPAPSKTFCAFHFFAKGPWCLEVSVVVSHVKWVSSAISLYRDLGPHPRWGSVPHVPHTWMLKQIGPGDGIGIGVRITDNLRVISGLFLWKVKPVYGFGNSRRTIDRIW